MMADVQESKQVKTEAASTEEKEEEDVTQSQENKPGVIKLEASDVDEDDDDDVPLEVRKKILHAQKQEKEQKQEQHQEAKKEKEESSVSSLPRSSTRRSNRQRTFIQPSPSISAKDFKLKMKSVPFQEGVIDLQDSDENDLPHSSTRHSNSQKNVKNVKKSSSSVRTKDFKIKMKPVPCLLNKDSVNVTCDRCSIQFASLSKFLTHLHSKFNINITSINNNKNKRRPSILKSSFSENRDDDDDGGRRNRRKRSHVHFEPEDCVDDDDNNNDSYFDGGGDDDYFSDNNNDDDSIIKEPKAKRQYIKRKPKTTPLQKLGGQIVIIDFGCPHCPKSFRKEEHLDLHVKVCHPETLPPPPSPPPKIEEKKSTEENDIIITENQDDNNKSIDHDDNKSIDNDDNKITENEEIKITENDTNSDIGNVPDENNVMEEESTVAEVENSTAEENDIPMDSEELVSSNIIEEPEQNTEIPPELPENPETNQPETTKKKRGRTKIQNLKHRKLCPYCPHTCKSYKGLEIHISIKHRHMPEPVEEEVVTVEENNEQEEEEEEEVEEEEEEIIDDIEEEDDSDGSDVDFTVVGRGTVLWAPMGAGQSTKSRIKKEIRMLKNPPPKPVKEKIVPETVMCETCGKVSKSPRLHRQHLRCHDEPTFVCTQPGCTKSFRRQEYLKVHLRLHLGEFSHMCDQCGRGFVSRSQLSSHLLTHGEKNFKCDHEGCSYQTVHKKTLSSHIEVVHEGKRAFSCSLCNETFKYRSALARHMFLHTGIKPHKCNREGCDYASFASNSLRNHERTAHQGLPPIPRKQYRKKKVPKQDQQLGQYDNSSSHYQPNQPIQNEQEEEEEDYESESDDDDNDNDNEAAVNANTNFY